MNWYLEVLKKYTVFNGRATRSEYWYFTLFNIIATIICSILDAVIGSGLGIIGLIYALAVLLPYIGVMIRRLHDINRSGWWQLIAIVPILGWILIIIWTTKDSDEEANQYGENPKVITPTE
ncbi:DUF805 domain-containing protein [Bathymodiolus septemdierum thioautotrophic gill symbiont]|uniref:DUF805 domain-containing protein n=1 Tax=endosymbiont of Bathymodiolus septemdierum str. Myojin knoll TaxID=1303921 RepID=A0A0P0UT56_9GAMM|nr:DUF805 domain-containing protein [Bathymodiolus septemdierum thioautotrophic gill symbiont]BAS68205.1 conserved hypothetical protein [endosymbiont of Bathymodiolus septemdierum str. Myojin knoll]